MPPFKPKEVVCACVDAAEKAMAAIANRKFLIVGVLFCSVLKNELQISTIIFKQNNPMTFF